MLNFNTLKAYTYSSVCSSYKWREIFTNFITLLPFYQFNCIILYVLKLHSEKREKKSPLIESTANMDNNQTQKTFKK